MAGPPARAKAEGRGATAGTAAAEGRPRRGAVMCQSLCPPQRPWHRAGIFPAGAPPPFGSPCRHFVDAPGGRRLLRVFRARCHAILLPPPRPSCPLPGPGGHGGLRVPSRPAGTVKAWVVVMAALGLGGLGLWPHHGDWGKKLNSSWSGLCYEGQAVKLICFSSQGTELATPGRFPALPHTTEHPKVMGFSPGFP